MRNINVDREPISSEEISTFKDFKSILQKHGQTTSDLAKMNPGSNLKNYMIAGGVAVAVAISSLVLFSGSEDEKVVEVEKPVVVAPKKIDWKVMFNTANDPIHDHFDFDQVSTERIEYSQLADVSDIKSLIANIEDADAQFVLNKKIFKLRNASELSIAPDKNLYKLEKGNWTKVDNNPVSLPTLVAPVKVQPGKPAIQINVTGFGPEYKEFENMLWQPVNFEDLDASFFDSTWPDGSIVETNVKGVYKITLIDGDKVKKFNGYPVLQKYAYKKALKVYNKALAEQQELLKKSPKEYNLEKGIYTIE